MANEVPSKPHDKQPDGEQRQDRYRSGNEGPGKGGTIYWFTVSEPRTFTFTGRRKQEDGKKDRKAVFTIKK